MLKLVMKALKNNICRAKQFFKILLEFLDLIRSQSFGMMCLFSGGHGRGRLRVTVGWMCPWGFDMKPCLFGCDFRFWIGCGASLLSYPEIGFLCYFRASLVQICTSLNMLSSLRASLTCGMFMWVPIAVTWITILSKQVRVHCFMQNIYMPGTVQGPEFTSVKKTGVVRASWKIYLNGVRKKSAQKRSIA